MNQRLSEIVIGCALEVHRTLGPGFPEPVYANALAVELLGAHVPFQQNKSMSVRYRGQVVGEFCCHFLIEGRLILDITALSMPSTDHEAHLLNHLKAGDINAGLLLNFGATRLGIKRLVLRHDDTAPI